MRLVATTVDPLLNGRLRSDRRRLALNMRFRFFNMPLNMLLDLISVFLLRKLMSSLRVELESVCFYVGHRRRTYHVMVIKDVVRTIHLSVSSCLVMSES